MRSTKNLSEAWRACPGFTLTELLVVIAIIAILIPLLIPAVQKVNPAPPPPPTRQAQGKS